MGANFLLIPSAFTSHTGKAHWHILVRSRAIENQCIVIAAAQTGSHNEKRSSFGHSMIVDAFGRILCEIPQNVTNEIAFADIDISQMNKIRMEMPVFEHRRDDVYKLVLQ